MRRDIRRVLFLLANASGLREPLVLKAIPYVTKNGTVCSSSGGCRSFAHFVISAVGTAGRRLYGGASFTVTLSAGATLDGWDENLVSEAHAVSGDCSNSSDVASCVAYGSPAVMYSWGWSETSLVPRLSRASPKLWVRDASCDVRDESPGCLATLSMPTVEFRTTDSPPSPGWASSVNYFSSAATRTCDADGCRTRAHVVFSATPPGDPLSPLTATPSFSLDQGNSWSSDDRAVAFYEAHVDASDGRFFQAFQADYDAPSGDETSICFKVSLMNKLTGQRAALDFGNGANHHCFTIATALVPFHNPAGYCPGC